MVKVRAVALDIDGTLTIDRGGFLLHLGAVEVLRRVAREGVHVILVSGNSVPVVAALARYLGFERSPHVCENGCLVFHMGRVVRVCVGDAREAAKRVWEVFGEYLEPSWQNPYRHCDYAFIVRGVEPLELLERVRRFLREEGFEGVEAGFSGYALHVKPSCVDKARGLAKALEIIGVSPDEVIAVGDSELDAELSRVSSMLIAVGNADERLKHVADFVAPGRSGESVKWVMEKLLEAGFDLERFKALLGLTPSR